MLGRGNYMKRQNGMLKKSVAFALALVMSLGQAPMTLLASEESIDTSLIPQVEGNEVEGQSEESNTESVDSSGATASLETSDDTSVTEEPTVEEPSQEGVTSKDSSATPTEDSLVTVTEAPAETADGDFTDGSDEEPIEGEDSTAEPEGNSTENSTEVTPTPTQAVEEVVQFDYEGTYNALKSSWNADRDTSRDSMLKTLVNKTGLVKYRYGAGHSASYFAEKGISDVADALYITENPEYLDDTGLIAWALWFNGRKEASYWVADIGMKGINDSDYFQSVNYDQLLPGDISCSEDGVWAIYGGKLDGCDVWIGSYHTDENPELGVCCDNVYRKDFKYFYRFTGFTDALNEDINKGKDDTEATPTEAPKEENKEEVEPTEAPKEDTENDEDKGELSGVLSAETLDPEGNAVNVSFTGDELQDDYIGNASLSDDKDKELYNSLAECVGGEFNTVLPLMLDVTDENGNEVSEVGTVKVDIDSSIDFTDTVLYHYENEEWVKVDYEVVDGGVEFVTGGFSPFFFIKESNTADDEKAEDTTTDDTNKDDTPDVNNGLIVNMVNEGTDSVMTGDTHKIALKTSYANPNDEDTANVKVYMWDGNKLDEKVPAEGIIIKNLVDNKLIYQVENNKDLSVEVEYKTDKDENGKVTASYLEFNLNPGTSLDMELEFTVKNGYYDEKSLRFSIDSSRSSGEVADNDFSYVCNPIKWTGEFDWNSLVKKSNVDNVGFDANNHFNKDINYTFSAVHSSFGSKGS